MVVTVNVILYLWSGRLASFLGFHSWLILLQNVIKFVSDYTLSHPRRQSSKSGVLPISFSLCIMLVPLLSSCHFNLPALHFSGI